MMPFDLRPVINRCFQDEIFLSKYFALGMNLFSSINCAIIVNIFFSYKIGVFDTKYIGYHCLGISSQNNTTPEINKKMCLIGFQ